jgi:hypothetical protein
MELETDGLLELDEGYIRLSERGRLLSNTVFEKFLVAGNAELRTASVNGKPEVLKVLK